MKKTIYLLLLTKNEILQQLSAVGDDNDVMSSTLSEVDEKNCVDEETERLLHSLRCPDEDLSFLFLWSTILSVPLTYFPKLVVAVGQELIPSTNSQTEKKALLLLELRTIREATP